VPPELLDRLVTLLADRYHIERELGSGGMATVYLAHDVRHDRKVALKVLRPELAAVIGGARFLAEIKTTANLQHPHILSLHDSGQVDGTVFYIMPFIDGETLRDRMTREKQLPVPDAIRIATAVADALQYAHSHGVIHRDIKPENILLHDGHALVADFGIALAASSAGSRMTETGMSLGTPHYMSPEQAMGERDLDARTDVYALGCVVYEMLTGQPPFTGPTAQAIVARVITETPVPPSKLRSTVSEDLDDAVLTALEKLPADRFGTAAEFGAAIDGSSIARSTRLSARRTRAKPALWRTISYALGATTIALVALTSWALARAGRVPAGPASYDAALPDSAMMSFSGPTAQSGYGATLTNISVAPDGSFVVYPAVSGDSTALWLRSLRDASARPIAGTAGAIAPSISPDGSRLAFVSTNRIMVVPIEGGAPKELLVTGILAQVMWVSPTRLVAIHTDGTRMTWLDPESGATEERSIPRCQFARWITGQEKLVCSGNGTAFVLDPVSGEQQAIRTRDAKGARGNPVQGSNFRVVDGRYLVYLSSDGELRAASYDPERTLIGRGVALVTGIRREGTGNGQFDFSAAGDLVYAPGANAEIGALVVLKASGTPVPLQVDPASFQRFDLSRDRRWLAAVIQGTQNQELRVYDLRDGQSFVWWRAPTIRHPLWSPDGSRLLTWVRDSLGTAIISGSRRSNGSADTLLAAKGDTDLADPMEYFDDHTVVATSLSTATAVIFDPLAHPVRLVPVATGARFTTLSPDRKLLAYQTTDGRVMVSTYPPGGEQAQVGRGVEPLWMSNTTLMFRFGVSWFSVRVDPATGEAIGAATLFGRDPRFSDTSGWSNRLSHDGGIIYVQGPEQSAARYLRVIPNWVSRMKAEVDSVNR